MKPGNLFSFKIKVTTFISTSVCLILIFLWGCGIYAIDTALKAPYNLNPPDLALIFTGDNEDGLLGYNIWYKVNEYEFYQRCYYNKEMSTPTITKTGEPIKKYTVSLFELSPASIKNFVDINRTEGTTFYFAVSAYGTGVAESGKAEFGRWPN